MDRGGAVEVARTGPGRPSPQGPPPPPTTAPRCL
uniref:Uncharacterized protein n=1 Tax=Siphoviridae sp. ctuka10 TaxID=2825716 RepID=A0A8S5PAH0_9CAUD|nr:MAG TPA: hypothetical protein [Siphoviridae sp. ctuka10]